MNTVFQTRTFLTCLIFGCMGIVSLNAQSADESALTLGDPAPAFTVTQFVQGSSIDSIALGTVHVIEFSGTTCKPCIQAIPTMEALQKKYDQAVFVSVFSGEKPAEVRAFLGKAGKAMTGQVAADQDGSMWQHWLVASGEIGIPLVFVVDKDKRIAWIGQPDDLPEALAVVVAGKHEYHVDPIENALRDIRRVATLRDAKHNDREREASRINNDNVTELIQAKNYQAAVDLLDGTIARFPDLDVTEALRARRLFLMGKIAGTRDQAFEAARDFIVDAALDSTGRKAYLCHYVMNHYENAMPDNRDNRMLLLVHAYFRTDGLEELPKYDSVSHHEIVARAYHLAGQRDKAIEEIKRAIEQQQARLKQSSENNENTDDHLATLNRLSEILKGYEQE